MTGSTAIDVRQLINQRPLGAYQKLIVLLCFCIIALDGMDIAIMGFIAPSLKTAWGIGNAELAVVISAALIGLAVGAMVSGPLADWRGRKTIIIASVFLFGLWTLLTAFSENVHNGLHCKQLFPIGKYDAEKILCNNEKAALLYQNRWFFAALFSVEWLGRMNNPQWAGCLFC
ncbi:MFS transporter [Dickeya ananatis]